MTDFADILHNIRRPRLLMRAARFGQVDYDRRRDLKRVLGRTSKSNTQQIISGLIEKESQLEETRIAGEANYSIARHVEVLIALMAEARLVLKPQRHV